jgi:hypothetical protein
LIRSSHETVKQEMEPATISGPPKKTDLSVMRNRRSLLRGCPPAFSGHIWTGPAQAKRWESYEERNLVDAVTGASAKTFNSASLKDLKETVPMAKIRDREFSRLILGGNLLSGWAHSRDLIYVSQLVKAYHQKEKIFATLLLAKNGDQYTPDQSDIMFPD